MVSFWQQLAGEAASFVTFKFPPYVFCLLLAQAQTFYFLLKLCSTTDAYKVAIQSCSQMRSLKFGRIESETEAKILVTLESVFLVVAVDENKQLVLKVEERYSCFFTHFTHVVATNGEIAHHLHRHSQEECLFLSLVNK